MHTVTVVWFQGSYSRFRSFEQKSPFWDLWTNSGNLWEIPYISFVSCPFRSGKKNEFPFSLFLLVRLNAILISTILLASETPTYYTPIHKVRPKLSLHHNQWFFAKVKWPWIIAFYITVDPRIVPLVVMVKRWAKAQDINDASKGTISSYSLVLMVIHYLQCEWCPLIKNILGKVICLIVKYSPFRWLFYTSNTLSTAEVPCEYGWKYLRVRLMEIPL